MILLELLGLACLTHLIVDFIQTLDLPLPNKPFKCDMCLGYWISMIPLILAYGIHGFAYAAIVGVLADIIYRIKERL